MSEPPATVYDEVPYLTRPLPQTHPDRLATLATLFGMAPAPISSCRVLELGCGDGGNLIPMAFGLPESQFVGLDRARSAIARGQARIDALGLKNVALEALDIRVTAPDLGKFDYLVANGLYSWVPPDVRDTILALCRDHLQPNGVAFVSYNAYPGWRQREMIREMLLYRIRSIDDPKQRIAQAREFARYLAECHSRPEATHAALIKELKEIEEREDFLLCHDDLSEVNAPAYFHEFTAHAARFGLQFLAEANFFEMQDETYPPRLTEPLRRLAADDVIAKEQYLDFLKCRRYRQTLLCHEGVALDRPPRADRVPGFRLASRTRPVREQPSLAAAAAEQFRGPLGATMTTAYPPVKAALLILKDAWPRSLPFPELTVRIQTLLGPAAAAAVSESEMESPFLAEVVLRLYAAALVELQLEEPSFATHVSDRPVASPLVRLQIRAGNWVLTNLRHMPLTMRDSLSRQLVLLLDGTRDRAALLSDLAHYAVAAVAPLPPYGQPVTDPREAKAILEPILDTNLADIARLALLVG